MLVEIAERGFIWCTLTNINMRLSGMRLMLCAELEAD